MKISQCPDCGVVHHCDPDNAATSCPKCGGTKDPKYAVCYPCSNWPARIPGTCVDCGGPTDSLAKPRCLECWKADRNGGNNQSAKAGPVAVASAPPRAAGLPTQTDPKHGKSKSTRAARKQRNR